MKSLTRIGGLKRDEIDELLERAHNAMEDARRPDLRGTSVALLFASPSLRTRVGFEVAAARCGSVSVWADALRYTERMSVPESVEDAVRSVAGWFDVLCLRHPDATAVDRVSALVDVPIINCGNGSDEHPTQALVDLFAIERLVGQIDGLRIAVVGDLNGMRVAHSLLLALSFFEDVVVIAVSPPGLEFEQAYLDAATHRGLCVEQTGELDVDECDVVYAAGLPRGSVVEITDEWRAKLQIDEAVADRLGPHAKILCPLPRIDEVTVGVDRMPQAGYFEQSSLGMAMRMAILGWVLNR